MLALSEHLFDSVVFQRCGILTSTGIQKRYIEACSRRSSIELCKEFVLINISDNEKIKLIDADIKCNSEAVNVYNNPHSLVLNYNIALQTP